MNWLLTQMYNTSSIKQVENDIESRLVSVQVQNQYQPPKTEKGTERTQDQKQYNIFQPAVPPPPCACHQQPVFPAPPMNPSPLTAASLQP